MRKRLYRSRTNKVLFGVCGGLGDYFDVDPAFVRVAFVLLAFANGIGLIAYIVLALAAPKEPEAGIVEEKPPLQVVRENVQGMKEAVSAAASSLAGAGQPGEAAAQPPATEVRSRHRYLAGVILVVVGVVFLMGNFGLFWWLSWGRSWPLVLIAVGLAIIWAQARR